MISDLAASTCELTLRVGDLGDKNGAPGSDCDKYCKKVKHFCGDGYVDAGEECKFDI